MRLRREICPDGHGKEHAMTYQMNLHPSPFEMIKCGKKTIELRLFDERRRNIKVGDTIVFTNTKDEKLKITAKVLAIHVFSDFKELYANLPLLKCGYTEEDIENARPEDMDIYYSPEKQREYGALGIELQVI